MLQSGTCCLMNLESLTVLIVLNGSWKQFSLAATGLTSALEVIFYNEMRYINLRFTLLTYLLISAGVFNGGRWSDSGRNQGLSGWTWNGFGQQASWTVPTRMYTYYGCFNLVLFPECLFSVLCCNLDSAAFWLNVCSHYRKTAMIRNLSEKLS